MNDKFYTQYSASNLTEFLKFFIKILLQDSSYFPIKIEVIRAQILYKFRKKVN